MNILVPTQEIAKGADVRVSKVVAMAGGLYLSKIFPVPLCGHINSPIETSFNQREVALGETSLL